MYWENQPELPSDKGSNWSRDTTRDIGSPPKNWDIGYILPIFKGGDRNAATNYRGITLNNILSKIYTQMLLNRLTKWTCTHNKITANQFGYQKNKSIIDCIFILKSAISKVLSSGLKIIYSFYRLRTSIRHDHSSLLMANIITWKC